ncbi:MAG: class I SAM-dependent rRNA methyltransferase [bacterium]|nr:class I SAM-dependent rRNA methyltransferase [bacterium]
MYSVPECRISKAAEKRIRLGHQWIFANELLTPVKELPYGNIVKIVSDKNHLLDYAFSNPNSLITLRRLLTNTFPDSDWIKNRLENAFQFRLKNFDIPVYRLAFSEGDYLSGLTIDRFDNHYVLQITSAGMEKFLDEIVGWLKSKLNAKSIIARNETSYRKMEGLSTENVTLYGNPPENFEWNWYGIQMISNLKEGQKTGAYLDQRFHYLLMDQLSKGKKVLDLFCHTAGFGIRAAKMGAEVIAVDSSKESISLAKEIAKRNQVENRIQFIVEDANHFLKNTTYQFDTIVCDPPPLIKSRKDQKLGEIAYQKLNQRCFEKLHSNGILITFSCSHLLTTSSLFNLLVKSAKGMMVQLISTLHQPKDHPILLSHPETEYLKGYIFLKREVV